MASRKPAKVAGYADSVVSRGPFFGYNLTRGIHKLLFCLVGAEGFEPPTPCSQSRHINQYDQTHNSIFRDNGRFFNCLIWYVLAFWLSLWKPHKTKGVDLSQGPKVRFLPSSRWADACVSRLAWASPAHLRGSQDLWCPRLLRCGGTMR